MCGNRRNPENVVRVRPGRFVLAGLGVTDPRPTWELERLSDGERPDEVGDSLTPDLGRSLVRAEVGDEHRPRSQLVDRQREVDVAALDTERLRRRRLPALRVLPPARLVELFAQPLERRRPSRFESSASVDLKPTLTCATRLSDSGHRTAERGRRGPRRKAGSGAAQPGVLRGALSAAPEPPLRTLHIQRRGLEDRTCLLHTRGKPTRLAGPCVLRTAESTASLSDCRRCGVSGERATDSVCGFMRRADGARAAASRRSRPRRG